MGNNKLIKFLRSIFFPVFPGKTPSHFKFSYYSSLSDKRSNQFSEERIIVYPNSFSFESVSRNLNNKEIIEAVEKKTIPLTQKSFNNFYNLLKACQFQNIGSPTSHNSLENYSTNFYSEMILEIGDDKNLKEYSCCNTLEMSLEGDKLKNFERIEEYLYFLKEELKL